MQMRRGGACIAGVADEAEQRSRLDALPAADMRVAVEMRIVMPLAGRTEHPYDLSSQLVAGDAADDAFCRRAYRRTPRCKNIDPLMPAAALPACMPRIAQGSRTHALHGHSQACRLRQAHEIGCVYGLLRQRQEHADCQVPGKRQEQRANYQQNSPTR